MGFPIHRTRIVITGVMKDFAKPDAVMHNFQLLMSLPLPACADWRAFLGRAPVPKYDLSSIGGLIPNDDSAKSPQSCTCSVDPYQVCTVHPCYCRMCSSLEIRCEWRKTHTKYIQKHIGENDVDTWVANTCKLMSYLG